MPKHDLSSNELLDHSEADKYFWNNLEKLNQKKNNTDVQLHLTLTSLQQQIQRIGIEKTKSNQTRRRALKIQAIELFCPEFSRATESLKKQFLLSLYKETPVDQLDRVLQAIQASVCDQMLQDIDSVFDRAPAYDFAALAAAHKVIARQKPSFIYFDQRRAFSILRTESAQAAIFKINNIEKSLRTNHAWATAFKALQNYHPFVVRQSQATCEQAFSQAFLDGFAHFYTVTSLLNKEYQQVIEKQPFFLWRPFYAKTMRVIQVWQYELLVQQLRMMQHAVDYLKKYRDGLIEWLKELNRTGPISFLLTRKFRDFFLQSVINQNEMITKNYSRVAKQLRLKGKAGYLHQDLSFLAEVEHTLKENKKQLTEVLQTTLGTVDSVQASYTELPPAIPIEPEHSGRQAWASGEKIPDIAFAAFVSEELTLAASDTGEQKAWLENVIQNFGEKIKGNESELAKNYGYIKQILAFFLQLKKDSFLTTIKKSLQLLPREQQQQPVIKYCLSEIGLTISERLAQVQNGIEQVGQACVTVEARLAKQLAAHPLLAGHVQKLLHYAVAHPIHTAEQLLTAQPVDMRLVIKMLEMSRPPQNAQNFIRNILSIAGQRRLLNEYLEAEKQFKTLHAQDKFVPEIALPMPCLEQNNVETIRRQP